MTTRIEPRSPSTQAVKARILAFFSPIADATSPSIPGRSGTETVSCLAFGISSLLPISVRPVQSRQQHSPATDGLATQLAHTTNAGFVVLVLFNSGPRSGGAT